MKKKKCLGCGRKCSFRNYVKGTSYCVTCGCYNFEDLVPPVSPFAIDSILARPRKKNFIWRVGLELEGGWLKVPEGVDLAHDGSVCGINLKPEEQQLPAEIVAAMKIKSGELPSSPMEVRQVESWMRESYPSHVNETCGLHVHMSFKSALHYMWLMVPEFQETVKQYVQKWAEAENLDAKHPLWKRLRGENTYCADGFYADLQASQTRKSYNHDGPGNRYTMINYCHGLHETLECRLLPMFEDVDQGIRAVQNVIDVTNACIVAAAKKSDPERVQVGDRGATIEESEEFV